MSAKHIIALFLVQYVLFTHCQLAAKFFRKDYEYIENTETFYKFHTTPKSWKAAKESCEFEGASLFYASDEDESMTILDYWNRTETFQWVWIVTSVSAYPFDLGRSGLCRMCSIYHSFKNELNLAEFIGLAIWQVDDKWLRGEPNNPGGSEDCVAMNLNSTLNDDFCEKAFAFICKKTLKSLVWNMACNLPDQSYLYSPQERFYKFHLEPRSWEDAVTICNAEQSYLAIINSDVEAELLVNITKNAPKDQVEDTDFMNGTVHLGFKFDRRWRTLKGHSLLESGYAKWDMGQPDGKEEDKCGSMFYNGNLNDIACSQKSFFICEHETDIFNAEYDFRFDQNNQIPAAVCSYGN